MYKGRKHLDYLVTRLNPVYLVMAIEVNELILHSPSKWNEYKLLATEIRTRLKEKYSNLKIAQSITLHNLYQANETESQDVFNYINSNNDFVAISFYPFFKNLHTEEEFSSALNYLNDNIELPISFVETAHLSEDLTIPNLNVNITSSECEQREYLKTLSINAHENNYEFVIWWAHKDYDALWEIFPAEVKDLGQIWRDTGLIDENDYKREAYYLWDNVWRINP